MPIIAEQPILTTNQQLVHEMEIRLFKRIHFRTKEQNW